MDFPWLTSTVSWQWPVSSSCSSLSDEQMLLRMVRIKNMTSPIKNGSGTSDSLEAAFWESLHALSRFPCHQHHYTTITYQYELGTQSQLSLLLFLASRSCKDSFLFSSDFCSLLVPSPFEPNFEENGIQWKRPRQMWTAQVLHFLCQSVVYTGKIKCRTLGVYVRNVIVHVTVVLEEQMLCFMTFQLHPFLGGSVLMG